MASDRKTIKHFRQLDVYRLAFDCAMEIFRLSKGFPSEERYSLTDQIRRSSRSVCSNIAEGWRKRKYKAVFKSKMTGAMQEASETQTWLDFCLSCNYMNESVFEEFDAKYEKIIGMLNAMERKADSFCFPAF